MLLVDAVDIALNEDLDPRFGLAKGLVALKYSLLRRLSTPEGGLSLADYLATTYGYSLTDLLGRTFSASELALVAARISAECLKDERVADASTKVSLDPETQLLTVTIVVITQDREVLTLLIPVDEISAEVLVQA